MGPTRLSAGGGGQCRKRRPVRGQGGENGTPQNKRREVCLGGGVGGWPTASHPFYEWGGWHHRVSLQAVINQTLTLPCVQGRESPALRPLHAPVHGSNTGAKNNLDHNSLLPHPTTSPGPSGCTPRDVDPPPGPGNVESIVAAPCHAVPPPDGSHGAALPTCGGKEGAVSPTHAFS